MSDSRRPAVSVVAVLGRFQRRLRLVAFVKTLPLSVAVAAAGALAVARIAGLPPTVTAIALLVGVLAATLASAAIARRHTGLGRTAAAVDRRFGLSNRIATALECRGHDDAMSALVVADAEAALCLRRPQDVPFEAPRHLVWIATLFAAAVAAFVLVGEPSTAREQLAPSEGVLGGSASASPANAKRTAASPAAAASASDANDTARRSMPAAPNDRGQRVESPQAASTNETADRLPGASSDTSSASERGGESRNPPGANTTQTTRPNGANSARQGGRDGAASADGSSRSQAPAGRGGAGTSSDVRATTDAAGGVRGTSTPDARASGDTLRAGARASDLTPAARWDRAESALAREHLPFEMRKYVRDYLVAIRTGSRP